MRCRSCDYSLFNLTARSCPECGAPFRPSDYIFHPNAVRFCCPRCDQAYYGTDESGHLVPREYTCVTCGERIEMDSMVLRPAEGVNEKQTVVGNVPWLDRKSSNVSRAWWRTVVRTLFRPISLARGLPERGGRGEAWWFAIFTMVIVIFMGASVPQLVGGALRFAMGGGDPTSAIVKAGIFFFVLLALAVVTVVLWALTTHAVLRLTGGAPRPISRTFQAILYSTGAMVTNAIPCVGLYTLSPVGLTWWVVSASIMVQETHRTRGTRAVWATLTFPVLAVVLAVGGFIAMTFITVSRLNTFASMQASAVAAQSMAGAQVRATGVLEALIEDGAEDGVWPIHAAQLVSADVPLSGFAFQSYGSIPVQGELDGFDFQSFDALPDEKQRSVIAKVVAGQPSDVIAHRLGEFVFTYHGIDPLDSGGGLWLFVTSPEADGIGGPGWGTYGSYVAGRADGAIEEIAAHSISRKLREQNERRAKSGLAELPPPWTVKEESPATSKSQE